MKNVQGLSGPTTRSRANPVATTKKNSTDNDTTVKEAAKSVLVQPAAQLQLPCHQGVGTMADYFAMRERQEKEAADVAVATGSGTKNQNDRVPETDFPDIENEEAEAGFEFFYLN